MISATRLANPNHARSHFPDEAVKFEKKTAEVQDHKKITIHFRRIYRMYPI